VADSEESRAGNQAGDEATIARAGVAARGHFENDAGEFAREQGRVGMVAGNRGDGVFQK
jgi:hypothetical protein